MSTPIRLTTQVQGLLPLANGGTNADLSATGGSKQYLKQASAGAAVTVGTIPTSDLVPSVYTSTATGNIDDLDFSNADLIRMNNASLATIRGLKAGSDGQRVTIVSIGAGQVDLAHQNTNSAATNRLINFATGANTSLAAGVGTSTYQYDATTARWRLIAHLQGAPIAVAYNSGNFTGNGSMTWTVESGDQTTFQYVLIGTLMFVDVTLDHTSVGGTPNNTLSIAVPGGFTATKAKQSVCIIFDNTTTAFEFGLVRVLASAATMDVLRVGLANFSASTDNTWIRIGFSFQIT